MLVTSAHRSPSPRMVALLRVALVTAYDGTSFRGWADVRDVALRPALERVLGQPIHIEAASRTDAGVHARGQVCAFDVERAGMPPDELSQLQYSLNQLLPPEANSARRWRRRREQERQRGNRL